MTRMGRCLGWAYDSDGRTTRIGGRLGLADGRLGLAGSGGGGGAGLPARRGMGRNIMGTQQRRAHATKAAIWVTLKRSELL